MGVLILVEISLNMMLNSLVKKKQRYTQTNTFTGTQTLLCAYSKNYVSLLKLIHTYNNLSLSYKKE